MDCPRFPRFTMVDTKLLDYSAVRSTPLPTMLLTVSAQATRKCLGERRSCAVDEVWLLAARARWQGQVMHRSCPGTGLCLPFLPPAPDIPHKPTHNHIQPTGNSDTSESFPSQRPRFYKHTLFYARGETGHALLDNVYSSLYTLLSCMYHMVLKKPVFWTTESEGIIRF